MAAAAAQPELAGSDACKTCHADKAFNFYRNPHFQAGCEGCHGGGKAHIEAGGGKKTIPVAFSLLNPKQAMDACLKCHAKELERANIRRSEHTRAEVACNRCHSIHKAATPKFLLAKTQSELCFSCHVSQRAEFSLPFRHRVIEGTVQCTDCHNPHGSFAATWKMAQRPRMVRQAFDSEQPCLKCHVDKRGPFVYEHQPIRVEGCASCHIPHGSANAKLLRRPVVAMVCLECHNGVSGFGADGRGAPLTDNSHSMLDPRYQKCTSCHVRLHGSNSDQTFFR